MEIRVLGPVEVIVDTVPLRLGGPRQERILATLVVSAGCLVATSVLVDVLWPARPPATARNQVQNCVGTLRRKLVAGGMPESDLTRKGPGYVLALDPRQLDVTRFVDMVGRARLLANAGRAEDAVCLLRQADELWRGPALAGLAEGALAGEALRMEELRMAAIEERIGLELSLGRHSLCVSELTALARAHPLRDRLQAELMVALHRCGRSADALYVFDRTRQLLNEEFGLEPGADLRRLQHLILTDSPELARATQFRQPAS